MGTVISTTPFVVPFCLLLVVSFLASFACPTREILSSRFTEDPGAGLTSVTIAESSLEPAILLMLNRNIYGCIFRGFTSWL